MPKSKRSKVVTLSKTESRGRVRKSELLDAVHKSCDEFKSVYVFSCENMRSAPLKDLRAEMTKSRFLFGKNKVMTLALGKTAEEAYRPGLDQVGRLLRGDVGLIFTNDKASEFEKKLAAVSERDYARAGFKAPEDVLVRKGPLVGQPSSMYEPLRKLLLPVKLNKAVVELEADHYVCKKGDVLSPEQAQALKFFDRKLAKFAVVLQYRWRDGELTRLSTATMKEPGEGGEEEEEEEEEGGEDMEEGEEEEDF